MHQYQCNGVLAGIAICRAGFPNKICYPEFKARYNILGASAVAKAKNDKAAGQAVMDIVKLEKDKFRLGHTKVFFRAGIGGWMEEQRENKIGSVLAWLQASARGKASRMQFKKLQDQKLALYAVQRSIRAHMLSKTWKWLQIWLAIKVLCSFSSLAFIILFLPAQPEVYTVQQVQEGVRGEDCGGRGKHRQSHCRLQ